MSRCANTCTGFRGRSVPEYRLSRLAVSDLKSISRYTFQNWGQEQAERYLDGFRHLLNTLAANPGLGRSCDEIRRGYRRLEHGSHVVFYRVRSDKKSIDVIRILHVRMLPRKYLSER